MWALSYLEELDKSVSKESGEKPTGPGYEGGFRHIWRQRFAYLHQDVIGIAVDAEWKQMKMNDETGKYERTYPDCWDGGAFWSTPDGHRAMRENR